MLGLQGCQTDGICYPPMTRRLACRCRRARSRRSPPPSRPAPTRSRTAPPDAARPPTPATDAAPPRPAASRQPPIARTPPAGDAPARRRRRSNRPRPARLAAAGAARRPDPQPDALRAAGAVAEGAVAGAKRREPRHARAGTRSGTPPACCSASPPLGALALALRKAGLALGWGFQLQQPLVVAAAGAADVRRRPEPVGRVVRRASASAGAASALTAAQRPAGRFLHRRAGGGGRHARAPRRSWARRWPLPSPRPTPAAMLVFLMLGLGLALPFLLIGFVPALARLLPQAGRVDGNAEAVARLPDVPHRGVAGVGAGQAARRRCGRPGAGRRRSLLALGAVVVDARCAAAAARAALRARAAGCCSASAGRWLALHRLPKPDAPAAATAHGIASVAYSPNRRWPTCAREGRVVFVNMTADWCVTCKANEKAVLARDGFRDAHGRAPTRSTWSATGPTSTRRSPPSWKQHKAVGVPLYVVFPRGGGEGRILPMVLTQDIVERRAGAGRERPMTPSTTRHPAGRRCWRRWPVRPPACGSNRPSPAAGRTEPGQRVLQARRWTPRPRRRPPASTIAERGDIVPAIDAARPATAAAVAVPQA